MTKDNYIVILSWMNNLGLSLVEKTVYAIIYGFSQDGGSEFSGGRQYLAEWCGCSSLRTIDTALAKLVERDLITKKVKYENNLRFCSYAVNCATSAKIAQGGANSAQGVEQKLHGGSAKFAHNNIENNADTIVSANKENNAQSAQPRPFDFKNALRKMGVSEQHASDWMAVRKAKRMTNTRTAFDRLKAHIERACKQYTVTPDDCVAFAASKDWGGFDSSWEAIKEITKNNTLNEDDRVRRAYAAAEAKFKGDLHF